MREKALTQGTLQVEDISLDVENGQVTGPNRSHHLTPMECRLLEVFMLHPGQVVPRAFLMKVVWETDYLEDTRTLDVHICWLRDKIEADPRNPHYLRTVWGVGYVFVPDWGTEDQAT